MACLWCLAHRVAVWNEIAGALQGSVSSIICHVMGACISLSLTDVFKVRALRSVLLATLLKEQWLSSPKHSKRLTRGCDADPIAPKGLHMVAASFDTLAAEAEEVPLGVVFPGLCCTKHPTH